MKEKNEPIRVAHVIGKWIGGGVEAVVMNYYRFIDKSKIQFDFICDSDSTNIPIDKIEKLGGKVLLVPPYQDIVHYHIELKKILEEGHYKIVHSHLNTLSVFPLFAAKRAGVPIRIAHSHSTTNKKEVMRNFIKQILRLFNKVFATDYFACTEHAGRWLFGNKAFDNNLVYLMNNAIDVNQFKYNDQIRKKVRKELKIKEGTLVIGHVGRFTEQKNQRFVIDIFQKYYEKNNDSILLFVGQGPLYEEMQKKVNNLKLSNYVKFLGQRDDVNELLQAFDVLLFPSLYEGLGLVVVEAQCSGCNCVVSSEVPPIAKVSDNIQFLDLNDKIDLWIKKLNLNSDKRENAFKNLEKNGYDIQKEVKKIEKKYNNLLKDIKQ